MYTVLNIFCLIKEPELKFIHVINTYDSTSFETLDVYIITVPDHENESSLPTWHYKNNACKVLLSGLHFMLQ